MLSSTGYDKLLNLLGVSTVAGNQIVEKVTLNALGTLTASGLSSIGNILCQIPDFPVIGNFSKIAEAVMASFGRHGDIEQVLQMWYKAKGSLCYGHHCCARKFMASQGSSLQKVAACRTMQWAAQCHKKLSCSCLSGFLHNMQKGAEVFLT